MTTLEIAIRRVVDGAHPLVAKPKHPEAENSSVQSGVRSRNRAGAPGNGLPLSRQRRSRRQKAVHRVESQGVRSRPDDAADLFVGAVRAASARALGGRRGFGAAGRTQGAPLRQHRLFPATPGAMPGGPFLAQLPDADRQAVAGDRQIGVARPAFTLDDQSIAAASTQGSIRPLPASVSYLSDLACSKVDFDPTEQEWSCVFCPDQPEESTCGQRQRGRNLASNRPRGVPDMTRGDYDPASELHRLNGKRSPVCGAPRR